MPILIPKSSFIQNSLRLYRTSYTTSIFPHRTFSCHYLSCSRPKWMLYQIRYLIETRNQLSKKKNQLFKFFLLSKLFNKVLCAWWKKFIYSLYTRNLQAHLWKVTTEGSDTSLKECTQLNFRINMAPGTPLKQNQRTHAHTYFWMFS